MMKIDNNYLLKLLYRQCNLFDYVRINRFANSTVLIYPNIHANRFANSTVLIYPNILANENSRFQKEAAKTLIHESGGGVANNTDTFSVPLKEVGYLDP